MRKVTRYTLILLAVLVTACRDTSDDKVSGHVVRDSAGIEIVFNHTPAWGELAALGDSAVLEIGTVDGPPETILMYPYARRLSDGRILVGDTEARELRYFGSSGEHLLTVGGEGPGPGEFVWLGRAFVLPGDTVLAFDHSVGVASIFDETGQFVRSVKLQSAGTQTVLVGVPTRDLWLAAAYMAAPDSAGLPGRAQERALYDEQGALRLVIDTVTAWRHLRRNTDRGSVGVGLPFAPRPTASAGMDHLFRAMGDRWEVEVLDTSGRLLKIIRKEWTPLPVTDGDVDAELARIRTQTRGRPASSAELQLELLEEAARMSETKPAIGDLTIDAARRLWVAHWKPIARFFSETTYSVFDSTGVWLTDVTLPERSRYVDSGLDYVLVAAEDELGVYYIQMFALTDPRGGDAEG